MPSLVKHPLLWIGLILLLAVVTSVASWRGWLPFPGSSTQQSAGQSPPSTPQTPEPPPLDVPSAITAILLCSYAIDRVLKGLLFLLALLPAWNRYIPDPASLPAPDSFDDRNASAEAWKNRKHAETKQKLAYLLPAFVLGAGLATFGHIRVLHVLGFPDKDTSEMLVDILLSALILMGGADQTAQVLRMLGAKISTKAEPSQPRPIEIHGKLILEEPREEKTGTQGQAAKIASHPEG